MRDARSGSKGSGGTRILVSPAQYALRADNIPTDTVLEHMKHDKKFSEGKIRFVLLRALGDAFVSKDVTEPQIVSAIKGLRF